MQRCAAASFSYEDCLQTDPFAGDFGDPGDKTLRDSIVFAGSNGPCACCHEDITPGSEIRRIVHRFEGRLVTYRYCTNCCIKMAEEADNG